MSTLSVIATPIGNLEDMTLRALRTLEACTAVICEDTRVTRKLLAHFAISKPLIALHANSAQKDFIRIERLLADGSSLALLCDAGTPGISDPGLELVSRLRGRFSSDLTIEAIPGPSALSAALSISGLRAAQFTFYGFLPLKKRRGTYLAEVAESERASVLYESPHRIVSLLASLKEKLPSGRRIGVFRELTKMHEESVIGSAEEVLLYFTARPGQVRGEFVVIIEGL